MLRQRGGARSPTIRPAPQAMTATIPYVYRLYRGALDSVGASGRQAKSQVVRASIGNIASKASEIEFVAADLNSDASRGQVA